MNVLQIIGTLARSRWRLNRGLTGYCLRATRIQLRNELRAVCIACLTCEGAVPPA